ncbi:MAG: dihydrodipicolinate synthase family protein, partial [Candidatus Dormiibacterota bacterium]
MLLRPGRGGPDRPHRRLLAGAVRAPCRAGSPDGAILTPGRPLHGTLAAAVTPLTADGDGIDEAAVAPLVDFYVRSRLDGLLVLGTTGEGILLDPDERRIVAEAFLAAARDRLAIAVHCGAQSTRDTVALAAHAAAR